MPYRRLRFYYAGIGIGSGSSLNPPRPICCKEALELIDAQFPPEGEAAAALEDHVLCCPSCCSAYRLEAPLRDYIAPVEMPTPSLGFEAALMTQIRLAVQEQPVNEELPATDFLSRWGWVFGLITLAALLSIKLGSLITAIRWLRVPALTAYAWAASYLRGDAAIVIGKLTPSYLQHNMALVGIMMAVLICIVGVVAVRGAIRD